MEQDTGYSGPGPGSGLKIEIDLKILETIRGSGYGEWGFMLLKFNLKPTRNGFSWITRKLKVLELKVVLLLQA